MSTHTPGPWHISRGTMSDGTTRAENIISEGGDLICEGLHWNKNGEIDGHLLAAAPELLAELVEMARWGGFSDIRHMERVDALIAKATGTAP